MMSELQFGNNDLISNLDIKEVNELNEILDDLICEKEDPHTSEFHEQFDCNEAPEISTSATVHEEDQFISESIEACIGNGEAEGNRHTAYDISLQSIMNELEETLERVKEQVDIHGDADGYNTHVFEISKSRQGSDGLETAAAVEQASLQFNCDTKKPNITTFSDASKNRTTDAITANREAPSSLGTTATIEETSPQTICTSENSNNTYNNHLNSLFTRRKFAKFVFPELGKIDNVSKQVPKVHSKHVENEKPKVYRGRVKNKRPNITAFKCASIYRSVISLRATKAASNSLGTTATIEENCAPTICASEESNNNDKGSMKQLNHSFAKSDCAKLDILEFDKTDHSISKQMKKRRSKRLMNKNKMNLEFHNTHHSDTAI